MRTVVEPLAVVDVAILVNEPSLSVDLVLLPHADKLAAILPHLGALALSVAGTLVPLADVDRVVVQAAGTFGDEVLGVGDIQLVIDAEGSQP